MSAGKIPPFHALSGTILSALPKRLTRQYNAQESRRILRKFKVLVKALAVDEKIIELALNSNFGDFEDAVQYYTAVENNIHLLLTRNTKNYKKTQIAIMTPETYLKLS